AKMDNYSCMICSYRYKAETVVPVALPLCGHTFCRSCLVTLQSGSKHLLCPTCRTDHHVYEVNRLPTNFSMLTVAEEKNKEQEIYYNQSGLCKCPLPSLGKLDGIHYQAARQGDLGKIKSYLANGGDINASTNITGSDTGYFMLSGACYEGRINVIQELLKSSDLHLNARNIGNVTPLMTATYRGHLEAVCCLMEAQHKCGLDVCATDNHGNTALDMAVDFDLWNIAAKLLEKHHSYKVRSLLAIHKKAKKTNKAGASTVVQLLINVYGV
ncbi:unnamed protein product, partial [Meganyctiphanes norvegica]